VIASRTILCILVAVAAAGCAAPKRIPHSDDSASAAHPLERFEFTRLQMGVQSRVILYAIDQNEAEGAANEAFARIAYLDSILSDYRPDSELMRLSAQAGGQPVQVSEELFEVLATAQQVAFETGGAFDVTAGPISQLWREWRRSGRAIDSAEIERAMALVGWRHLRLDAEASTVQLTLPAMRLDLGGIAKGYAVGSSLRRLRELGFSRSMVALAGDIAVGDPPPSTTGWRIALPGDDKAAATPLLLSNACISTSGDLAQYIEIDGTRHSHIIDPRPGGGVRLARTMTATVIVPGTRGEFADAFASAICVEPDLASRISRHFTGAKVIVCPEPKRDARKHEAAPANAPGPPPMPRQGLEPWTR
jgi:FAD:protein FMN transferase